MWGVVFLIYNFSDTIHGVITPKSMVGGAPQPAVSQGVSTAQKDVDQHNSDQTLNYKHTYLLTTYEVLA